MDTPSDAQSWTQSEFGHAAIPDACNVARLVQMAARVAERPQPKVLAVFDSLAEREGAYDFLENDRIAPRALVDSSARATARRARGQARVLIALDGVSLTFRDPHDTRGTGSVGDRVFPARGFQVLDAVALTEEGILLGLAALQCWARSTSKVTVHHRRAVRDKETRQWIEARATIREAFEREAPDTQRVFLHDSGADAWPILIRHATARAEGRPVGGGAVEATCKSLIAVRLKRPAPDGNSPPRIASSSSAHSRSPIDGATPSNSRSDTSDGRCEWLRDQHERQTLPTGRVARGAEDTPARGGDIHRRLQTPPQTVTRTRRIGCPAPANRRSLWVP